MKKIILILALGMFSLGVFASNNFLKDKSSDKKEKIIETPIYLAEFPVYCDGEYAGDADTIREALALCGM